MDNEILSQLEDENAQQPAPAVEPPGAEQAVPVGLLESLNDEDDEFGLKSSFDDLPSSNPDDSAKIIDLSRQTGEPESFVEANLQNVEAAAKARPDDYWQRVERDYPGTTHWLKKDRNNMAVAHDDVDNLAMRERLVNDVGESLGYLLDPAARITAADQAFRGAVSKAPTGFTSGTQQVRLSQLGWCQSMHALTTGEHDPTFDAELIGIETKLAEAEKKKPGFNPFYYGAQQVPNLMFMAQQGAKRAMQGGLVFGGGALLTGPGPQVPIAFGLGTTVGGRIGAYEAVAILEGGAAYREFSQLKDKNGNQVNPRLAAEMAIVVGAVNAGLEYLSLVALLRTIPGGTRILGHLTGKDALFKGLRPGMAVREAAKRYLTSIGTEVVTELAQEAVSVGVGEVGKAVSGQPFEPTTPGEAWRQITAVASPAAQATMLLGFPGTAVQVAGEINKFQQTDVMAEAYEQLGAMAAEGKLVERSPEALGDHLNSIAEGTKMQDTYISAEDFATYSKRVGMDPADLAKRLGFETLYQEALETKGDIKMPSGDWAVRTVKAGKDIRRDIYHELSEDVKHDPEGYTPRQKDELGKLYQEQSKAAVKEADRLAKDDPIVAEDRQRISDQRFQQLKEAGRPEKEARAAADLYSSMAITLAAQTEDMTAEQANQALVSHIQGVEELRTPGRINVTAPELTETNIEGARKKLFSSTKVEIDARPEYLAAEYLRKHLGPGFKKLAIRSQEKDLLSRSQRHVFESAAGAFNLGDSETLIKIIAELPSKEDAVRDAVDVRLSTQFGDPRYFQYATSQLDRAKKLHTEKKPREEIQQTTGWLNEDGKWRYSPSIGVFGPRALYQQAPITDPRENEMFNKWFGNSEVVDEVGKPLVVYHGTPQPGFKKFDIAKQLEGEGNLQSGSGFYFTESSESASNYAVRGGAGGVYPVYLKIEKPLEIDFKEGEVSGIKHKFSKTEIRKIMNLAPDIKSHEGPLANWGDTRYEGYKNIFNQALNSYFESQLIVGLRNDLFGNDTESWLKALNKATGFDGAFSVLEDGVKHWVAWFPEQIKSAYNLGTFDPANPDILYQQALAEGFPLFQPGELRSPAGAFDPRTRNVALSFKNANASTFMHETAHAWLTLVDEMVKDGRASESLTADHTKLMAWLGAEFDKPLTTEQQEKFAAAFEAYLREGKAPTAELRTAFARFKRWLTVIYRTIQDIGGGILGEETTSPEVREIMDRMLATEDEINSAEKTMDFNAEIDTTGMDSKVVDKLGKLRERAHEEAAAQLMKQQMAEIKEDRKAFLAGERARMTEEATEGLKKTKLYIAISQLGESEKAVVELAQKYIAGDLPEGAEELWGFDMTAETLDYYSGEVLAKEILAKRPLKDEVAENVDRRMGEAYSDLKDTEAMRDEAMKAVHSDYQLETMALEREILKSMVEGAQARAEASRYNVVRAWMESEIAKARALEIVSEQPVGAIKSPGKYYTAERVAASKVAQALARKDYGRAAQYKQTQLVNHALALATIKMKKQIDKAQEQIRKIGKLKQEKMVDQETYVQVHRILERFGFMNDAYRFEKTETLKQYLARTALAFQSAETDESTPLDIPEWIADEATSILVDKMTVDQLLDVRDALRNIVHVEKMIDRFFVMSEKERIGEAAVRLSDEAAKNVKKRPKGRAVEGARERVRLAVGNYQYSLEMADTVMNRLDGFEDFGVFHKTFTEQAKNAADLESARRWATIEKLNKIWGVYSNKEINDINSKKLEIPEFGLNKKNPLYKHQLLAMALNLGNEINKDRLLETHPVNFDPAFIWDVKKEGYDRANVERYVMSVLERHLDRRDWQFVQNMWNLINEPWNEISALHKRVTGFGPRKVEDVPFEVTLPNGEKMTMEGGYYPLEIDPRHSEKAAERELLAGPLYEEMNPAFKAMTRTGHTKVRTGAKYAVSLKLGLISRHMNDVLHDLYFRELVIDLRRLGANQQFVAGMKETIGEQGYRFIDNWIKSVATGRNVEKYSTDAISSMARALTRRAAGAIILMRVAVILQNFANPFLVPGRVKGFGPGATLRALLHRGMGNYWAKTTLNWKAAAEMREWVWLKSSFMRDRRENPAYTLKIYEGVATKLGLKGKTRDFMIGLLAASDDMTNIPMWTEAYHMKLKETGNEKEAVNYADLLVSRTTPSGRKYDVAQIIRGGHDVAKLFTVFYGFWNVEYNNWVRELGKQGRKPIENSPRFMGFVASRFMFVFASAVLANHHPDEEWDFKKKLAWWIKEYAMYPISFFPFFRDVAGGILDNSLGLPNYGYRPFLMAGMVENLWRATAKGKKYFEGEAGEQELIESFAKLASFAKPYPDQLNVWFFNAYDSITNNMEPRFLFEDIYKRRRKDDR